MVLGGGLEPPRLSAYAPQTYVSAISPPELVQGREMFNTTYRSRKADYLAVRQGRAPLVRMSTCQETSRRSSADERELVLTARLRHQGCLNPLTRPG